jgi:FeoC like transcriptional regulator
VSSPLRAVLDAFATGAHSRAELSRTTGLRPDVVDAAVEHLIRMGRIDASPLTSGCPGGGCGSCPSGVDGAPGCGAGPAKTAGPVLLQLTVRR